MSDFKIYIKLNKNIFTNKMEKSVVYLERKGSYFRDRICFDNNLIVAKGSRTKKIDNIGILETQYSTYYNLLLKALLYSYFTYRTHFELESIIIKIDDITTEQYSHEKIHQLFKVIPKYSINCSKLFLDDKKKSDLILISLMNLTLSFNDSGSTFDYNWKCFNALIRGISGEERDFDMLKYLRTDLEENIDCYGYIMSFIPSMDINYIKECSLKEMIQNNHPRTNNSLVHFLKDFKDYRVSSVLLDLLESKKIKLNDHNIYSDVESHYKNNIINMVKKPTDIVRLIILKYAYYLRCKYFHAEKLPSNFLLENKDQAELTRISIPLSLLCRDLLENRL